jgi:hypothetical protein
MRPAMTPITTPATSPVLTPTTSRITMAITSRITTGIHTGTTIRTYCRVYTLTTTRTQRPTRNPARRPAPSRLRRAAPNPAAPANSYPPPRRLDISARIVTLRPMASAEPRPALTRAGHCRWRPQSVPETGRS